MDVLKSYLSERVLSDASVEQYTVAHGHWTRHFGSRCFDVSPSDLRQFSVALLKGRSESTVNKIRRHLLVLMRHAVEIGALDAVPRWLPLREPKRLPKAFTVEEFRKGLGVAKVWPGTVCGVPAGAWWESLLLSIWYSGARIGAMLGVVTDDIVLDLHGFYVRHKHQKDASDEFFKVGKDCVEAIKRAGLDRRLMWPWRHDRKELYKHFRRMFSLAGVKLGRGPGSLFHRIRRSTASYLHANGGDATRQLGHSRASITEAYFDPRICGGHDSTSHMPPLQ